MSYYLALPVVFFCGFILAFVVFSYTGEPEYPKHYHLQVDMGLGKHDIVLRDEGHTVTAEYFLNDQQQLYIIEHKDN